MRLERISDCSGDYFSATTIEPMTIHEFTVQIARQYERFMRLPKGCLRTKTLNENRMTLITIGTETIEIEQAGYSPRDTRTPKEPDEFFESDTFLVNTRDTIHYDILKRFRDYLKRNLNGQSEHANPLSLQPSS